MKQKLHSGKLPLTQPCDILPFPYLLPTGGYMFYPVTVGDRLLVLHRSRPSAPEREMQVTDIAYDYLELLPVGSDTPLKLDAARWNNYHVCRVLESSLTYSHTYATGNTDIWTHTSGDVIERRKPNTWSRGRTWHYNGVRVTVRGLMQLLGELQ